MKKCKKLGNIASVKYDLQKEAAQRTCTVIAPAPKKDAIGCSVYILFLYILVLYVYLYTQFQKSSWPGKLLNFTEIHRKYYKNFHFHLKLIYPMLCDLRDLEFDLVDQGLPEELHFFIFKVP